MIGRITKGIAGFYYVHDGEDLYECKAKGIFRKNREKPLTGDHVEFSVISREEKTGNIDKILERKNRLLRPEVANVDGIFLVLACVKPEPNFDMLNRYLVLNEEAEIPVSFVLNKTDLTDEEGIRKLENEFINTGYPFYPVSAKDGTGFEEVLKAMNGKVISLAGPSGVGKSSIMNRILGHDRMETGGLSEKIDRGKNTTRHSELFYLGENTYLFDTPGFTSVEVESVQPENLPLCFPEFRPYLNACRFHDCEHLNEPDCSVKAAVSEGKIALSRYQSYRNIHAYLKDMKKY